MLAVGNRLVVNSCVLVLSFVFVFFFFFLAWISFCSPPPYTHLPTLYFPDFDCEKNELEDGGAVSDAARKIN